MSVCSRYRPKLRGVNRRGMTLIEVLLAATILSLGIVTMLTAISRCIAALQTSIRYQDVMWALSAGETEHPLVVTDAKGQGIDEPEDMEVSGETYGDILYERTVEDPYEDDEDSEVRLVIIKTKLSWEGRTKSQTEEITRYWLYRENP